MSREKPLPRCPQCGKSGTVREILWGLPMPGVDESRYELGGCVLSGDDPELTCLDCDWSGFWAETEQPPGRNRG